MKFLVRMETWKLFTFGFALPFFLYMILMAIVIISRTPIVMIFFPVIMIPYLVINVGWIWVAGTGLHSKVPEESRMNLNSFRLCVIYPVVHIFLFAAFIIGAILTSPEGGGMSSLLGALFMLLFLLHLIAMACGFYSQYYVARNLIMAEKGGEVDNWDVIAPMVLLWFWPVGIWFVQPRLQKLLVDDVEVPAEQM